MQGQSSPSVIEYLTSSPFSKMLFPLLFVLSTLLFHATGHTEFPYAKFDGEFLDIAVKGNQLWAVFCNSTVVRANLGVDGSFQSWTAISTSGIPAAHKVVSLGASPDGFTYGLTNTYDNNIYCYNPGSQSWQVNPGHLDQISAASNVMTIGTNRFYDHHWATNFGFVFQGQKGKWSSFGMDKSRWIVDVFGRVRRCLDSTSWCPGQVWEVMCLRDVQTVEAQNKDRAIATNAFGEMYAWDGKGWNQLPFSGKATRASITDNFVYWLNEKGNAFHGRYK